MLVGLAIAGPRVLRAADARPRALPVPAHGRSRAILGRGLAPLAARLRALGRGDVREHVRRPRHLLPGQPADRGLARDRRPAGVAVGHRHRRGRAGRRLRLGLLPAPRGGGRRASPKTSPSPAHAADEQARLAGWIGGDAATLDEASTTSTPDPDRAAAGDAATSAAPRGRRPALGRRAARRAVGAVGRGAGGAAGAAGDRGTPCPAWDVDRRRRARSGPSGWLRARLARRARPRRPQPRARTASAAGASTGSTCGCSPSSRSAC